MVGEARPGVDRPGPGRGQGRQARDEIGAVYIIPEEGAALEPPHHHVVEGRGGIEPGLARHSGANLAPCV